MWTNAAVGLRWGALRLLGPLTFLASHAHSQHAVVRGVVIDSSGAAIARADVGILALHQLVRTDEEGRFVFRRVPVGTVELSVRRLGYVPKRVSFAVTSSPADSVAVVLAEQPEVLDAIEISAMDRRRRAWIEEFYRRRTIGIGTYFTRDEIQERKARFPSDVVRSTPGIRLVRVRNGLGIRFNSSSIVRRDCIPMIWLDGQRAPEMEIDDLPVNDIEGIELYNGASTTPMQFSQSSIGSTCGTVVVWSRVPGT